MYPSAPGSPCGSDANPVSVLLAYPFPMCDCALREGYPGVCVQGRVCVWAWVQLVYTRAWVQGCALMHVHVRPVS